MRCRTESVDAPRLGEGARLRVGRTLPPGTFLIHLRDAGEECPRPSGVSPLSARSATKLERGACPRKGRQPRRSGCAVRPRRTTEHGAGALTERRAGRGGAGKGRG